MYSQIIVRDIRDVDAAKEWCRRELRQMVWEAAFSEFQGTDDALVTVVKTNLGYQVRAEL